MSIVKKYVHFFLVFSLLFFCVGCGSQTVDKGAVNTTQQIEVKDSLGRSIVLDKPLTRVAVANAYNAELITAIHSGDAIVGVDYNIYQDKAGFKGRFKEDQVIGGSQRELNYEKIIELNPDALILTGNGAWENAEKKLEPFGIKVIVCDAYYTDKFIDNVEMMGKLFGKQEEADKLMKYFSEKLDYIKTQLKDVPKRTVYFEYRRPGNTTIPGDYFYKMVEFAHGDNIFKDARNVQINLEDVVKKNPAYIVKVSEPNVYSSSIPPTEADMKRIKAEIVSRPAWDAIDAVKNDKILLMSHYVHGGASKLVGTMYIAKFMYPEYLPDLNPEEVYKEWVTNYQGVEYLPGHTSPAY